MVSLVLIILPFLATLTLASWQYWRIDPVRGLLNPRLGVLTVVTIGGVGGPLCLRFRPRDWGTSWGVVCLSVAASAGAYYPLRRIPPGGTG
jgi:hypothetical protein